MAGYDTFADLRADVLDRAGESATDTAGDFYAAAGRFVVRAHQDLCNAHPYLFLRKDPPGALVTVVPYRTGTLAVTGGAAAITFGTPPAAGLGSFAGRKLVVTGMVEFYRILTHTAGAAAATLDVPYNGADNGAALFTAYQDEYSLAADVRHLIGLYVAESGWPILQRSEETLRDEAPEPARGAWPPRTFARIGERKIRFSEYPTQARRLEYPYTVIPGDISGDTDGSLLLIPRNFRQLIADGAAYHLLGLKEDSRAGEAAALFGTGRERLIEDDGRKRMALMGPASPERGPY